MAEHAPRKGEVAVRFRVGAAQLAQWQVSGSIPSQLRFLSLFFWGAFFFLLQEA